MVWPTWPFAYDRYSLALTRNDEAIVEKLTVDNLTRYYYLKPLTVLILTLL